MLFYVKKAKKRWRQNLKAGVMLERRGMKVSRSKTVYLYVNTNKDVDQGQLQNVELTEVTNFTYVGSIVQSNRKHGREVKEMRLS